MSGELKIVLIDDDETYNAIMKRAAVMLGLQLEAYTSLVDLGSVGMLGRYDVAIVDYQLGQITGVEIAQYLSELFRGVPMVLVSQSRAVGQMRDLPDSIAAFIHKSEGYGNVLEQAARIARRHA